jgi:hypothetical protein
MRLCIADPPYLGRAHRYYGVGGSGAGHGKMRADEHPAAVEWDNPDRHVRLVHDLDATYDAWAIAMTVYSIGVYASAVTLDSRSGYRFAAWVKPNGGVPSGSRIHTSWEPVLFHIPLARRKRESGPFINDHLAANAGGASFMGAKPQAWTRWVLDLMGYDPEQDTVTDLFPGSGAVTQEINQGVLL